MILNTGDFTLFASTVFKLKKLISLELPGAQASGNCQKTTLAVMQGMSVLI